MWINDKQCAGLLPLRRLRIWELFQSIGVLALSQLHPHRRRGASSKEGLQGSIAALCGAWRGATQVGWPHKNSDLEARSALQQHGAHTGLKGKRWACHQILACCPLTGPPEVRGLRCILACGGSPVLFGGPAMASEGASCSLTVPGAVALTSKRLRRGARCWPRSRLE